MSHVGPLTTNPRGYYNAQARPSTKRNKRRKKTERGRNKKRKRVKQRSQREAGDEEDVNSEIMHT